MERAADDDRTTPAPGDFRASGGEPPVRRSAARWGRAAVRLVAALLAAPVAAVAGLVFAALLPICGIATISEGIAKAAWRFVREMLERRPHPRTHRI